eukprot:5113270-Pleurochrysis_carterae.AAC.2
MARSAGIGKHVRHPRTAHPRGVCASQRLAAHLRECPCRVRKHSRLPNRGNARAVRLTISAVRSLRGVRVRGTARRSGVPDDVTRVPSRHLGVLAPKLEA